MTQDLALKVDLRHVTKYSRSEPNPLIRRAVLAHGNFVVCTRRVCNATRNKQADGKQREPRRRRTICPGGGREDRLGDSLERAAVDHVISA